MKRFICLFVVICMAATWAIADDLDYASMTDDQLAAVISAARSELLKRDMVAKENLKLFEQDGISLYLTGGYEVKEWGEGKHVLELEGIVINDTDQMIDVRIDNVAVNGWEVYGGIIQKVGAGNKKKDTFEIRIYDADIHSFDEITDIQFVFRTTKSEGFDKIFALDPITVQYNK